MLINVYKRWKRDSGKAQTIRKYQGKWLKVDLRSRGGGGVPYIICVKINKYIHIYIYIYAQAKDLCTTMVNCRLLYVYIHVIYHNLSTSSPMNPGTSIAWCLLGGAGHP